MIKSLRNIAATMRQTFKQRTPRLASFLLRAHLMVTVLSLPGLVQAYDFKEGSFYYNRLNGSEDEITYRRAGIESYVGDVEIPASVTYEGTTYTVTAVGTSAFKNCVSVSSVVIPEGVTELKEEAFYGCENLTSVELSEGLLSIDGGAFESCKNLYNIIIPNTVTYIGGGAFYYCNFEKLIIPASIDSLDIGAFHCLSVEKYIESKCLTALPLGSKPFDDNTLQNTLLRVPSYDYKTTSGWKDFSTILVRTPEPTNPTIDYNGMIFEVLTASTSSGDTRALRLYDIADTTRFVDIPEIIEVDGETCTVTEVSSLALASRSNLERIILPATIETLSTHALFDVEVNQLFLHTALEWKINQIVECSIKEFTVSSTVNRFRNSLSGNSIESIIFEDGEDEIQVCPGGFEFTNTKNIYLGRSFYISAAPALDSLSSIETFHIGPHLNAVTLDTDIFRYFTSLRSFTVHPDNIAWADIDGVLWDNERTLLYVVPMARTEEVVIPSTCKWTDYYAFDGCTSIPRIRCEATTPPKVSCTFPEELLGNCPLYVPAASLAKYKTTAGWKDFANIRSLDDLADDTTSIDGVGEDDATTASIRTTNQTIMVESADEDAVICILTVNGQGLTTARGTAEATVQKGIYLVAITTKQGTKTTKVTVR